MANENTNRKFPILWKQIFWRRIFDFRLNRRYFVLCVFKGQSFVHLIRRVDIDTLRRWRIPSCSENYQSSSRKQRQNQKATRHRLAGFINHNDSILHCFAVYLEAYIPRIDSTCCSWSNDLDFCNHQNGNLRSSTKQLVFRRRQYETFRYQKRSFCSNRHRRNYSLRNFRQHKWPPYDKNGCRNHHFVRLLHPCNIVQQNKAKGWLAYDSKNLCIYVDHRNGPSAFILRFET